MKLGIRKIQYVPLSRLSDYSFLPAGGKINFSDYISGDPADLPFINEIAEYNEDWKDDLNGRYSVFSFSGTVRKKKEEIRPIFNKLLLTENVFIITFIDGRKAVIGSLEFIPKFTYSESVSGISKDDLKFSIELESLHGVLWDNI